jgi:hypothetical protein
VETLALRSVERSRDGSARERGAAMRLPSARRSERRTTT